MSAVFDLLCLVGLEPRPETVASWSPEQRLLAEEWAAAVHFSASDNDDVVVPPRPAFLPEPWTGPWQGEGVFASNPTVF